jgi:spore germination protein KA/spore germination protein
MKKISAVHTGTSRKTAGRLLSLLKEMASQGRTVAGDLSGIIAQMRSVPAPDDEPFVFVTDLQANEKLLRGALLNCGDVTYRKFNAGKQQALLVYAKNIVDKQVLERCVLSAIFRSPSQSAPDMETIAFHILTAAEVKVITGGKEVIEGILSGKAALLVHGCRQALIIDALNPPKRFVERSEIESVIRGPHDSFNETFADNLALIRRRSKDSHLKMVIYQIGERTKTMVGMLYIDDLAKPSLIAEVDRRLQEIHIDKILSSSAIEEQLIDKIWTPFPQIQYTERPDKAVSALYDGRVCLVVDNTAVVLQLPITYQNIMQSPEDYTTPAVVTSLIRFTRFISSFVAVFLPAIYVSIVSYHPGMLASTLALSIAELRARTPFPSFLEAAIMEALLEIFQEAVTRLPEKIAGAAGIVGAIVIGTTVVQAGLVNPLLVVVTAITGLSSYTMPSYNFAMALRFFRIPILILGSILGMYGVVIGFVLLVTHMCALRSFGESFFGGLFDISLARDWKDGLIRFPSSLVKYRSKQIGPLDATKVPGVDDGKFRK